MTGLIQYVMGLLKFGKLRTLARIPRGDAVVMIVTVALVVLTSDLAVGVVTGVALSALMYGWKSRKFTPAPLPRKAA